ncbi:hypothetical protein AFK68_29180 [Hydrocoleum sp. CS-953]|nr:hypothetical protein AFK68_29180 [Hydrocoleum sp. CS-953]
MQKFPTPTTNPQLKEIIAQTRQGLEKNYGEQLERIVLIAYPIYHGRMAIRPYRYQPFHGNMRSGIAPIPINQPILKYQSKTTANSQIYAKIPNSNHQPSTQRNNRPNSPGIRKKITANN